MVGARILLSFCLPCWAFHLVINQTVAAREVTTLNYLVKDQRIRVRRSYRRRDECDKNGVVDTVHGFSRLTEKDFNALFIDDNGKYSVIVSWKSPLGGKNNSLVGYWFSWFVFHDTTDQDSSLVCTFLTGEKTSSVVHESLYWRKDENISFAINPLPTRNGSYLFSDQFTPLFNECYKNEVDKVHGFSQVTDYNVQFIDNNGNYLVKVTWKTPLGGNNNSPVGYWFSWLVYRDTNYRGHSRVCSFLTGEKTSFVVHESSDWRRNEYISFAFSTQSRIQRWKRCDFKHSKHPRNIFHE